MAYIGQKPADKPLGASDITDGIISNSKLAQDIISAETELAEAPASTDEFLISDAGVLKRLDASFIGGANTPMFLVRKSSTQDVSDASSTQVTFDTEVIDTDNAFASNTFTVPSGKAGKYLITCQLTMHVSTATELEYSTIQIYKNDSQLVNSQWVAYNNPGMYQTPCLSVIMDLSAGDTLKVYTYIDVGAGTPRVLGESSRFATWFQGYKLIGV